MSDPWVRIRHLYRTRDAAFDRSYRLLSVNLWLLTLAAIADLAAVVPSTRLIAELPISSSDRDTVRQLVVILFANMVSMLAGYEITMRFMPKLNMVQKENIDD